MKKIVSIFAAALLAAGFMGCSNDSDDNSALLLALSSKKQFFGISPGKRR